MGIRTQLFQKVTIIGIGLIGGSLGMAIKKNNLAREVVGMSQRHSTLDAALKTGAVDHAYHDAKKAVAKADLVVLATPVSIVPGMLSMIAPNLKRNCIVTDVGSTKTAIVAAAEECLPRSVLFVGSHPLAGSEKKGVQNARDDLFAKSTCIITPTNQTNKMAREKIKQLWLRVGAHVKLLSPDEHDAILAYISHLPHLVAYALMRMIPVEYLDYAAQGLKDTTRIASSTPQVWNDICLGNAANIIKVTDRMVENLSALRKAILTKDDKTLTSFFKDAKNKRDRIKEY